ncbi:MAG: 3-oxoacyl-ACP reductase FabG [Chloroflexi bacterium]|nr:3-oxoacyl-ACP reductase FabG [Chloroflexota bacterium]
MRRLENRVAVVTGGARGLGKEICLTFAREGADIVIGDVIDMEDAVKEIRGLGRKAIGVKTDVTKKEQVENLINTAVENFKRVDILMNDAGISRHVHLMAMADKDWDAVFAVNLRGIFLCTQAAAAQMIKQKGGRIINMASASVDSTVSPAFPAYQTSKAGVVQFTKAAARELGPHGITVNAIGPAMVETDMSHVDKTPEEVAKQLEAVKKSVPLGRICAAQDVANLALFFASDEASFITGQFVRVDGGRG